MPEIALPDGSRKSFHHPVTVHEVAESIGSGLARAAVGGKVDGRLVDTDFVIDHDAQAVIVTPKDEEGLEMVRHSTAHLMAQAVKRLYPDAQVTIGPVIESGFYYDFSYDRAFTPEDLEQIEAEMQRIAKEDLPIQREEVPREDAVELFRAMGEAYKAEIIEAIPDEETLSLYRQGEFVDLCRGPHVPSTGRLGAFKLLNVAGAYWRGDSDNEMLQRIYGTAWPTKDALNDYLHRLEEAEKRDHRKIGSQLDLFSIQEEAGGGLVFWHPKGARVRRQVERFWYERHDAAGYEFLYTPHIANLDLWKTSGHLDFYGDSMYAPIDDEEQSFQLKPMNCPFHILIYKDRLHSYRDFPIRWGELGTVYRREMSGALHGLMRVRGFTQDDAHIFCREDQIEDEIVAILDLTLEFLQAFGFDEYEVHLSTKPEKAVGSDAIWDKSVAALHQALERKGLGYELDEGGGAFYGPKIDIKIKDAIGRRWQCSTVQLDFNLPDRFDMEYVAEDNHRHRPIMIHRAIFGSMERFFGVLVEHYAGSFPTWLAPEQAVVLNITDRQEEYARSVAERLQSGGFRARADLRNEKIGFKIREHTLQRVPYQLVVGDREAEAQTVAVRTRDGRDLGAMSLESFESGLRAEVDSKGAQVLEG